MKKLVGCGVYILFNKIMRLSDAHTNRITPLLLASLVMRVVCCIGERAVALTTVTSQFSAHGWHGRLLGTIEQSSGDH
jgi:hypothetical protein